VFVLCVIVLLLLANLQIPENFVDEFVVLPNSDKHSKKSAETLLIFRTPFELEGVHLTA
jgi:hypothetical protein